MRSLLERLWTLLFVALVQLPIAAVVTGLVGAQNGLPFLFMGIAAHLQVRSGMKSLAPRIAIWLAAMTVGGITAGLGAIAISLLMQTTAHAALNASGQVTNVFWFVVPVRLVIGWAPVLVAWVVSGILVRRSSRRGQAVSPPAATRQSTQGPRVQSESGHLQKKPSLTRGWRLALSALAVVAVLLVAFLERSIGRYQQEEERRTSAATNRFDELDSYAKSESANPFDAIVAQQQAERSNPGHEASQAALVAGAGAGDIAAMERALDGGADVNAEWFLNSPLAWAIDKNQLPAVKFLVARGADINAHFGLPRRTALQHAAEGGYLDIVAYLLEAEADINARNKFGRTALYHARHGLFREQAKAKEVADFLASKGAVE